MKSLTKYEQYHKTTELLSLQKKQEELCCDDELSFQIIPQICELHFKIILQHLEKTRNKLESMHLVEATNYLRRINEHIMLSTLSTNSLLYLKPMDFQKIRLELGNGSGQDSPGFILIRKNGPKLWEPFTRLLSYYSENLVSIHRNPGRNLDIYNLLQELMTFDSNFKNYRYQHMMLVKRTLGLNTKSLQGNQSKVLEHRANAEFFPELWSVISTLTDEIDNEIEV